MICSMVDGHIVLLDMSRAAVACPYLCSDAHLRCSHSEQGWQCMLSARALAMMDTRLAIHPSSIVEPW